MPKSWPPSPRCDWNDDQRHQGLYQYFLLKDQLTDAKLIKSVEARREAILQQVKVVDYTWGVGGLGLVGIIKVTIKNLSKYPLGNFKYETTYYSETGIASKSWGGARELEKLIKPGQTRTFEINDGYIDKEKAEKMSFKITGYDVLPN
jgi:hypothetical protein